MRTKKNRAIKNKTKKQFLYNPNNPKKSFDVYIDKNPKDTIHIKYTTLNDVKNTINNLEKLYKNKNCHWLTHNCLYSLNEKKEIRFLNFLQILNSSTDCISVDTYLKTLILLLQKNAKVIRSTFDGKYKDFGIDVSDQIFLNKSIWKNIKCYTFEELIFDLNTKNKLLF